MPKYVIIVIAVIGSIALVAIVLLLVYFCLRSRVSGGEEEGPEVGPGKGEQVNVISTEKESNILHGFYTNTGEKYGTGIKIP